MNKIREATKLLLSNIQSIVSEKHKLEPFTKNAVNFCAVDVSYKNEKAITSAIVWNCLEKKIVDIFKFIDVPLFPYISSFFFMREAPFIIAAVNELKILPDIVLVDGHGIAHPRGAGLAVFVGITLDLPVLGVAKSILVGTEGQFDGLIAPLIFNNSVVGVIIKNPSTKKKYFISPGHKLTVENCKRIVELKYLDILKAVKLAHFYSSHNKVILDE